MNSDKRDVKKFETKPRLQLTNRQPLVIPIAPLTTGINNPLNYSSYKIFTMDDFNVFTYDYKIGANIAVYLRLVGAGGAGGSAGQNGYNGPGGGGGGAGYENWYCINIELGWFLSLELGKGGVAGTNGGNGASTKLYVVSPDGIKSQIAESQGGEGGTNERIDSVTNIRYGGNGGAGFYGGGGGAGSKYGRYDGPYTYAQPGIGGVGTNANGANGTSGDQRLGGVGGGNDASFSGGIGFASLNTNPFTRVKYLASVGGGGNGGGIFGGRGQSVDLRYNLDGVSTGENGRLGGGGGGACGRYTENQLCKPGQGGHGYVEIFMDTYR